MKVRSEIYVTIGKRGPRFHYRHMHRLFPMTRAEAEASARLALMAIAGPLLHTTRVVEVVR
jgi:hypothetical protein